MRNVVKRNWILGAYVLALGAWATGWVMSARARPVLGPPTQIEKILTVHPNTSFQVVEAGRVLQSVPVQPGRYRVLVRIQPILPEEGE